MKKLLFSILMVIIFSWAFVAWNETSPKPPEQVLANYLHSRITGDTNGCYGCLHPDNFADCYNSKDEDEIEGYTITNKISVKSEHYFDYSVMTQPGDILLVTEQQERDYLDQATLMNVECRYLLRKWKGHWLIRAIDRPARVVY